MFVNREEELTALSRWWELPHGAMGLVWGRRRVGKTALLQHFAEGRRVIFHTAAGRPAAHELELISRLSAPLVGGAFRDLEARPFVDWTEAFEVLAAAAERRRVLVVLDEFPELMKTAPEVAGILRAIWDRVQSSTKLRILLCGSAVRTMEAAQEERAPLFGRIDLALLIHPFRPHEAARMLSRLSPEDRALVWGLVGGVPLYLERWDQQESVRENLRRLVCTPGGLLLTAGELTLATDLEAGDLGRQVVYVIANGRTTYSEIAQAVRAEPARTLERLVELRVVERLTPVTEDARRTRQRIYRVADNFLAFWLKVVDRYKPEIDRGLGETILPVLVQQLDDHLGPIWEEAFRLHLRRRAERGELGEEIVAIGPFWTRSDPAVEIDAVALAGRRRAAVLVGEAKWARRADGARLR
ncbi:MAG: ATP-binding protein, partial [Gaiellaceae bacterium]